MKRETLIFFLGLLLILMPFLGIPSAWKKIVYIALGMIFALVGYQLRRSAYLRSIEDHTGERKTDVYVEQVEQLFVEPRAELATPVLEDQEQEELPQIQTRRARTKKYDA